MSLQDKVNELEQRIYELECVLKHYPINKPIWCTISFDDWFSWWIYNRDWEYEL